MKKALRIVSIVYIPLLIISILLGIGFGAFMIYAAGDPNVQSQIMDSLQQANGSTTITTQELVALLTTYGVFLIVFSVLTIVALVADILLLLHIKKEDASYSKSSWIALGVVAFLFGAVASGVLGIVYGALLKNSPNGTTPEEKSLESEKQANPSDYDAPDHLE